MVKAFAVLPSQTITESCPSSQVRNIVFPIKYDLLARNFVIHLLDCVLQKCKIKESAAKFLTERYSTST